MYSLGSCQKARCFLSCHLCYKQSTYSLFHTRKRNSFRIEILQQLELHNAPETTIWIVFEKQWQSDARALVSSLRVPLQKATVIQLVMDRSPVSLSPPAMLWPSQPIRYLTQAEKLFQPEPIWKSNLQEPIFHQHFVCWCFYKQISVSEVFDTLPALEINILSNYTLGHTACPILTFNKVYLSWNLYTLLLLPLS